MSTLKVDTILKRTGTGTITVGQSGDTVSIPSGANANFGGTGSTITIPSGGTLDVASGGTLDLTGATVSGFSSGISDLSPYFSVRQTGSVTVTDNTDTKVAWNSELVDSDSAFASDKFTVPSGKAGKYFLYTMTLGRASSNSNLNVYYLNLFKNGSRIAMSENDVRANPGRKITSCVNTIQDLSAGDYIEVYVKVDIDGGTAHYDGGDFQAMFGGYKIG